MAEIAAFYYNAETGLYDPAWTNGAGLTKDEVITTCLECLANLNAEDEVIKWLRYRAYL